MLFLSSRVYASTADDAASSRFITANLMMNFETGTQVMTDWESGLAELMESSVQDSPGAPNEALFCKPVQVIYISGASEARADHRPSPEITVKQIPCPGML